MMSKALLLIVCTYLLFAGLIAGCKTVPAAELDTAIAVHPPFLKNKKFLVSQGFHGKKTHRDALNAYAVDLAMPLNEPVCAAKAGRVDSYKDVDKAMKTDKRFRQANFVTIKHQDGTQGLYMHLAPGSVNVKVGQELKRGECFAKVGNTGYSTAAHLHFSVLKKINGRLLSVPFRFINLQGKAWVPKYLQWVVN